MDKLKKALDEATKSADVFAVSPATKKKLKNQGINIPEPPELTLEENIDLLFSNERKKYAIKIAGQLPMPPNMASPALESLYKEIQKAIVLGLNGAAITLSGILVEYVLKYATYKTEIGGFAKYDSAKTDEFEKLTLGSIIQRAMKAGLLDQTDVDKLNNFKNEVRNPYNHYNIKKITSGCEGPLTVIDTKTGKKEVRHVKAEDDQVIQSLLKPIVDSRNVLKIFRFADSVVKVLWHKITV